MLLLGYLLDSYIDPVLLTIPSHSTLYIVKFSPSSSGISDERVQQLIDEALGKGILKQRDIVSTMTGLTGSGKTWLSVW